MDAVKLKQKSVFNSNTVALKLTLKEKKNEVRKLGVIYIIVVSITEIVFIFKASLQERSWVIINNNGTPSCCYCCWCGLRMDGEVFLIVKTNV